jgi:hypothetical protein
MRVKQGYNSAYLLRRLARDHPLFLAAYERGEYPNPKAAARAAGIKVDTPSLRPFRLTAPPRRAR